jgi:hypothetical protein
MPTFPSVEWFTALKDIVNADPAFRRLGTVDAVVGAKIGSKVYELTFEAFECAGVREVGEKALSDMDFWLEQPFAAWKEMIEDIKANGQAGLSHTLNTIDLNMPEGLAKAQDEYKRDAFYRFNQSIQDYFDASAKIETQFAEPAAVA